MSGTPTRRTTRQKKPSLKALESLRSLKIQNSGLVQTLASDDETDEDLFEGYTQEDTQKPKILNENELVHGDDIFTFPKRKTKGDVVQKVAEACELKTPRVVRKKARKAVEKLLEDDSESDFEVSEESESSSESGESSDTDTDNDKAHKLVFKESKLQSTQGKSRNYHIKTDEYFEKTSSKKITTSNNTLDKLETPHSILSLLEIEESPGNSVEACESIIEEMRRIPDTHLYIIIHNIEGETLRNSKSQNILANLAATNNIHLIVSIDHINASLIWDHKKLSKFNYIWWDATSFAPYLEETSFEQSMMVQQSSALALSSLRNVFVSLTSNSKSIYNLIAKYQIEHGKNQYFQGLAFKDLYLSCREGFIVSSDLALRAQLKEFVDHKMLKIKRSVDGTEYLLIPLASHLLQKFIDENN
ncbi:unnamed protein product [Phyllotreta striolata]|uniref:Origin recognition complex subunit 2 n=1 Tax=Phyllotreta striolata TaxID=444603 RepID=A0A9N9XJY8_PHYSR|nr:unnamed protein product [Phyllotreta striolata]